MNKSNIINIGPGGTFKRNGAFATFPVDIDAFFSLLQTEYPQKNIVLYFHGGLVSEKEGLDLALNNMGPHLKKSDYEPLFFIWDTGFGQTVKESLSSIGQTSAFKKILEYIIKKVLEKTGVVPIGVRGASGKVELAYIKAELSKANPFKEYDDLVEDNSQRSDGGFSSLAAKEKSNQLEQEIKRDVEIELQTQIQLRRELEKAVNELEQTNNIGDETGKRGVGLSMVISLAKIIYRVIKRFLAESHHGFYPTVVEEILREYFIAEVGAVLWNTMKLKSSQMWESNDGIPEPELHAGRYFLDGLAAYLNKNPQVKISLIGHSAGSIVIAHFLNTIAKYYKSISLDQIILLAPACRLEVFESAILKHKSRFNGLRIFTMSDINECNDLLVPGIYTRSLLYLISGILEDEGKSHDAPILGLERHISFKKPYDSDPFRLVHEYLYEKDAFRLSFSKTAPETADGMRTEALKHGDFDDDPITKESLLYILKYGTK